MRSTLVLLLGSLTGIGAGVLTALADGGAPRGVLYGCAAAGLAVPFFDRLIAADTPAPGGPGAPAPPERGRGGGRG
ncbi:hypothetical protein [Streptomyces capparidis]